MRGGGVDLKVRGLQRVPLGVLQRGHYGQGDDDRDDEQRKRDGDVVWVPKQPLRQIRKQHLDAHEAEHHSQP